MAVRWLIWVDSNDLRHGAKPLLATARDGDETRPNETTVRGSEIRINGPAVLRFDPDNTGLARVWIETDSDLEIEGEQPAYR